MGFGPTQSSPECVKLSYHFFWEDSGGIKILRVHIIINKFDIFKAHSEAKHSSEHNPKQGTGNRSGQQNQSNHFKTEKVCG